MFAGVARTTLASRTRRSSTRHLSEAEAVAAMNPEGLTPRDGDILIRIMRRQTDSLTAAFGVAWSPRAVDKVLWTYGRD
jgi:hypothetical protein